MRKEVDEKAIYLKEALEEAIQSIEKCIKSHSKVLKIGYNGYITIFPDEIRQLTWLTSLYMVCTEIRTLPDWIGELENLRILDISSNQNIRKLPSSLINLKHLKKLNLDNTGLKKLQFLLEKYLHWSYWI